MKTILRALCLVGFVGLSATLARGAVLSTETWDSTDRGWIDRDTNEMTVGFTLSGNPGGGLQGTFAAQGVPGPETDAMRANSGSSGGNFTGNYWSDLGGFNGWMFSFYAQDILPSDLQVRFSGNGATFFVSVLSQVLSSGEWYSIQTPTTFLGNWFGGSALQWSNALANLQYVEVQITRNGGGSQVYRIDNFSNGTQSEPPGPGTGSAVPEPSSLMLPLMGALLLWSPVRRAVSKRRLARTAQSRTATRGPAVGKNVRAGKSMP